MDLAPKGKCVRLSKILSIVSLAIICAFLVIAIPAAPVQALVGTIFVSDTIGPAGALLTISGTGFTSDKAYTVSFGTTAVLTGTISSTGALSTASFVVPSKPRGTYNITVTTTGPDTSNAATFTITPTITLSTSSGLVGDQFYVSGNGFSSSTTITIYFDSASVGTAYTDANGIFVSAVATVPETTRGSHMVRGYDTGYSPSLTYTVNPRITVSPTNAAVGAQVTISGSGFSASSPVTFFIDDVSVSGGATTSASGSFSSPLTVPAVAGGSHTLKAQDTGGASATVAFSVSQTMSIAPQTGPAGISVRVTGKGFGASKSITITYKNQTVQTNPSPVTTDTGGNFSATFTAPAGSAGSFAVVATDGTLSGSATFVMTASGTIGATKGAVGTSITLSGGGFSAGAAVIIRYDNVQIAVATADVNGALSTSFAAPPSKSGDHTVTASDGINTVTFTFNVVSSASLDQTSGYVGSDITISGTGFADNKAITIKYDDTQVATATTNAQGGFSVTFKAPASKGGNHVITATDGTNTVTNSFAMDSSPPPVPALLLPANDTKGDALARFTWSAVTDPSGVTYTLQVATDATFANIILERKDLTTPTYQLTEVQRLKSVSKKEPYYWRVKATDGAFNESDWTKPQPFFVGFVLATWGLYTIFGFIGLLIGVLGFWLGRRTSYHWDW